MPEPVGPGSIRFILSAAFTFRRDPRAGTHPVNTALSPYEITARSVGATLATLLCRVAVTVAPRPGEDPLGMDARGRLPLLASRWAWTAPLWHSGLLTSEFGPAEPLDEMETLRQRVTAEARYAGLRPYFEELSGLGEGRVFERLSRDLLTGGADPVFVVPLVAVMESFAARQGLIYCRTEARSLAGRLERRSARPVIRVLLPLLAPPDGDWILEAREALAEPLSRAAFAFENASAGLREGDTDANVVEQWRAEGAPATDDLREALREFCWNKSAGEGESARPVTVTASMAAIPADSALRVAAAARATAEARAVRPERVEPSTAVTTRRLVVMTVRSSGWER